MYYVYTLSDPETNVPFYVGYTKNFGSRYRSHLRAKESSPTAKHVQEMLSKESVPTFKIVATFDDKMSALEHEQKLISELSESIVLLNVNRANLDNPSPYYLMTHKLCGIDGLYCKRVYQCEICHEIERQYRTAMIEKALSGAPETLMLIVGIVERGGRIFTQVIPDVKKETLHTIIEEKVQKGTTVNTDELWSYNGLGEKGYEHKQINHSQKVYVVFDTHTQTIDGFWGNFKNGVTGVHHHISNKYLNLYLAEHGFRYSHRNDVKPMFLSFLDRMALETASPNE